MDRDERPTSLVNSSPQLDPKCNENQRIRLKMPKDTTRNGTKLKDAIPNSLRVENGLRQFLARATLLESTLSSDELEALINVVNIAPMTLDDKAVVGFPASIRWLEI